MHTVHLCDALYDPRIINRNRQGISYYIIHQQSHFYVSRPSYIHLVNNFVISNIVLGIHVFMSPIYIRYPEDLQIITMVVAYLS